MSPHDQIAALKQMKYEVTQSGPWRGESNRSGQTWKSTNKSDLEIVDYDDWGDPIFEEYAVVEVNLNMGQTLNKDRAAHLKSATTLLAKDQTALSAALSKLSPKEQDLFKSDLAQGKGTLAGYTWHHVGHEFGRLVLIPTSLHEAFPHTGWNSVLSSQKLTSSEYFAKKSLGRAMDAYSGFQTTPNKVRIQPPKRTRRRALKTGSPPLLKK